MASAAPREPGRPQVLFLGTFGLRAKGTMSARALPLASELVARGWRVRIIVPPWDSPEDAGRVDTIDGVLVVQVPVAGGPLAIARRMLAATRAAARHAGRDGPPLVQCFKPKGYGGLVAAMVAARGWPLIVDVDDWEGRGGWNDRVAGYSRLHRWLFDWQARALPRQARRATVASRTLETQAWSLGIAADRVDYLPNGVSHRRHAGWETIAVSAVDARAAHGLPEAPTVLAYTRFDVVDAVRLVQILAAVRERRAGTRLLVVGAGPAGEEQALARHAGAAGLADAVSIIGMAAFDRLPSLLRCADVGIYPIDDTLINRSKAPVKLIEMMALGLPIVAEAVGETVAYLRAGQDGVLVDAGDVAGLAAATARLLDCTPERERLGAAGRGRVWRDLTWERLADRAEATYCAALRG
jgi:glycosyltransferase involved in cell wall biosynthesis